MNLKQRVAVNRELYEDMLEELLQLVPVEIRHMLPGFVDRRVKEVSELRLLLERGDFRGIQQIGHKLKGTGPGFGFESLGDIGRELEEAGKLEDSTKALRAINGMATLVSSLSDFLSLKWR